MNFHHNRFHFIYRILLYLAIVSLLVLLRNFPGSAQNAPAFIRRVRVMEADKTGLSNPTGLAFSSKANVFHVVETPGEGQPSSTSLNLKSLTPFATRFGSMRIAAALPDPINITYDSKAGRLLFLQFPGNQLFEVREDSTGKFDPTTLTHYNARSFGLQNPKGMTVDPTSGHLFILDAAGPRIVRIVPRADGNFDQAVISDVKLQEADLATLRGIAYDPTSGHLHVLNPVDQKLYELTQDGQVIAFRDLTEFHLGNPQGILFAPSGDQTDDPSKMSLYLADSGLAAKQDQGTISINEDTVGLQSNNANTSAQDPGQILELSLTPSAPSAQSSFQSSLVRTVDLATISPPSPDPSGLTYVSTNQTFLMSDGEVDETVKGVTHFAGANVWVLTLSGTVVRTANISSVSPTVVPMTDEPNGAAWNPANGHFYFTDDDGLRVYDLNPASDGLVGTADDSWTSFNTQAAGSGDPEGIAFDSWTNTLFVVDGTNMEVYQFTLAGSLVSHFDVEGFGVTDPEGIDFNPDSGTLFVLSSSSNRVIVEVSTSGDLIGTYDVSASGSVAPAGLSYAPASDGSGNMRFYIVDRGIDNNDNPDIIDGKMYEMSAPSSTPVPSPTPAGTLTSTPIPTVTLTPTPVMTAIATQNVRVSTGNDDAEEFDSGWVYLNSSDLELVYDGNNQTVGMRFNGVTIPRGSTIVNAYVQFQAKETNTEATSLILWGQAQDNPPTFSSSSGNISGRARTTASVGWTPPPWTQVGQAGVDQRTPNLAAIIQEITNRPGWESGNSLVLIITGTGHRTAVSYDGNAAAAPLLHLEWSTVAPTATITPLPTGVFTSTASNTSLPTTTFTPTASSTPLPTSTFTPTASSTPLPTSTFTPTASNTPLPTSTITPTASNTPLPVNTFTPTVSNTPRPSSTNTPTPTISITPTTALPLHIGDLDGSSTSVSGGRWNSTVSVLVHNSNENPVSGATVTGAWSGGVSGSSSCTTDATGRCNVTKTNIKGTIGSVIFTISNVTKDSSAYQPAVNHDPDGDSNGTKITILKP